MPRVIREVRLEERAANEFTLDLPVGSIIRRWEMGMEEQKVVSGLALPTLMPGQKVMKEIAILFIDMDAAEDPPKVKRYFKVVQMGEPIEDEYVYVTSTLVRSVMRWLHLFEKPFTVY